jgi:hypothetical protein
MVFGDLWRYSFHSKEWLPARARVRSCEWKWKIPTRWDWHFGIYHVSLSYKVAGTEVISKFKTQENLKPGSRLAIRYDPADPERNSRSPLSGTTRTLLWAVLLVGAGVLGWSLAATGHLAPSR